MKPRRAPAKRTGSRSDGAPISAAALQLWPAFVAAVSGRLEAGAREYGDHSFRRPAGELVREIEQELLDVAGWSFILWARLGALKGRLIERGVRRP